MAENRVEFELAMKDEASRVMRSFNQEMKNTTATSQQFNSAVKDGEQLLRNFYREQRVQDRTMREATQALTGFTVGMVGLVSSNSNTSKSVKQFNDTILASVTAMQGAEFASASLGIAGRNMGGRLGSIAQSLSANAGYIGAIIGATTATFGLAKALADYLYPQIDRAYKFKEAAKEVNGLAEAFKNFQNNEAYKQELQKFIKDFDKNIEFQKRLLRDSGATPDMIARVIGEQAQKLAVAKAELERIVGTATKPKKDDKKSSGAMGGDELAEDFKRWNRFLSDIAVNEAQRRAKIKEDEIARLREQLERQKALYSNFSNAIGDTFYQVTSEKFEKALGNQNSLLEIFIGNAGQRLIAFGADMLAETILNAVIARTTTAATIAAETAQLTALLAVAGPTALAVNIASFGAAGAAAAASAATAGAAQLAAMAATKFHNGGTVGSFQNQPASREFPIMVRGGETVRTEGQERDLQNKKSGAGAVINIYNYTTKMPEELVIDSLKSVRRKTGLSIESVTVDNRSRVILS